MMKILTFMALLLVAGTLGFAGVSSLVPHAPLWQAADECACGNATVYRWRLYDGTWRCSDGVTVWNC